MSSVTVDKTENMEPAIQPHASNKYTDLKLLKPMTGLIDYSTNPTSPVCSPAAVDADLWQKYRTTQASP